MDRPADEVPGDRLPGVAAQGGVISVQVLNEFAAVASRKLAMSIPEIRECLEPIAQILRIEPLTLETHARGLEVAARYGFSVVDSMMVAAALLSGCDTLYSEDLHHRQRIDGLLIHNPFAVR